jgi:GNAT superfamily N-acetyltransferase
MSAKVFHEHHRPIRDRILYERGNATVIVCCSKEDPWLIIAWIAVEQLDDSLTIHYVYVKEAFKGLGIARRLVNMVSKGDVIYFTHLTDKMSKIAKARRDHRYKYVPHLV